MSDSNLTHPTYQVDFEPVGKRVAVAPGTTLLQAAQQAGLPLSSACGGVGNCGQCRLTVLAGSVSPATVQEGHVLTEQELEQGLRLACSTRIQGDVKVHVPPSSLIAAQRLQLAGDLDNLTLDPMVRAQHVEVPPPSLYDPRSDLERVAAAVAMPPLPGPTIGADLAVVCQITSVARACNWDLTAFVRDAEIVGVGPAGQSPLGLAIDLGTTKIAASLVDLASGDELAAAGSLNPQIGHGEDVVSRLAYALRLRDQQSDGSIGADGGHDLTAMVRRTLDDLLGTVTGQAGASRSQVADICIVGNTAMIHLLLDLPIRQLAVAPFVAATNAAVDVKARDLGLAAAPGAWVHVLPGIGGFVGADHVAMLLGSRLDQTGQVALGLDIGTNTEIVLARPDSDSLTSASCASGPAFEGAHISDGMRAVAGAIEAVELTTTGTNLKTVADAPAIGLCGSGIVDGVAELLRWGLINERGRFDHAHERVRQGRYGAEFLLVPADQSGSHHDIVITQEDVNEIQLAKGAIRAGLEVLLDATSTAPEEVKEVVIAGAFGSYLKVQSALDMGLLPRLPNARYRQVGNAALDGAKWALVSRQVRERARQIAARTRYLELTTYPKFNRRFALGMLFPADHEA
jgi:uncharacterized 2Fe-2S/4Fe-4S cluster protein (DUF4445 family)